MTSSNPNSPTNSPLNFRPFALGKRGPKFRFIPTNSVGLSKPVITQALQTGGDAIQVTWGESGGTSYALQVSTDGGTTFSDVTTTAGTSFTHTGLSFPGSYTYRVRATVDAEVSDWSDSVTETMVDVPAAPGGLTVTGATTSSISLSWNDTADEGSYSIEASVDGLGSWSGVGSTGQNVVTFTHSGLSESVQRHYRVTAFNKAGGSIPSSTANSWTVPAAPTGLTATAISTTQIDLSWTDVSTGNQSYRVERSTDNTNWTEIATGLSATATTYSATGLTASTQYWFRVRAANAARNSDYSNSATATTQASTTVPSAPSAFSATSTFADSVSLSWTDNSSGTGQETGFDIEVSTNAGSTYSSVTTTAANATSFSHTGRVESTTYLYRIRATNSAGSSSWVVGDDVTTTAAITGFTATAASSTQINLAWTDKSGVETGFRIERSTDNTNWSLVTTTAANATSFSNTGLNASTLYYYRIRSNAYNGTSDSAWYSAQATTTAISAPSGLTATATSSTQINLSWTDNASDETGFKVERSTDNTNWTEIAGAVAANSTSYSATGLTASTLYYFRVRAYNAGGNSAYTSSASATTQSGSSTYNVEYLVVAGGGGGSSNNGGGGGGGAGGYRTATGFSLTVGTSYLVTVGAGGGNAAAGNNSVFSTITSYGGGKGGDGFGNGGNGGSGGGGGAWGVGTTTGGTGTSGQGNNGGGNGSTANPFPAGGGGGASAAGANGAAGGIGGNGGDGTASSITGTSVTRAGGGGGGVYVQNSGTPGNGGAGGGGNGSNNTTGGTAGGANTGGGGGGGSGRAGGSGVVVLRMPTANYSGSTTGSPTVTTSGSDTILTYNASGTYTA